MDVGSYAILHIYDQCVHIFMGHDLAIIFNMYSNKEREINKSMSVGQIQNQVLKFWHNYTEVYWLASNEVLAVFLVVSNCTHRGHPDNFSGLAVFRIIYLDVETRDEGIQTYRHIYTCTSNTGTHRLHVYAAVRPRLTM